MAVITGRLGVILTASEPARSAAWCGDLLGMQKQRRYARTDGHVGEVCLIDPRTGLELSMVDHTSNPGDLFSEFRTGLDHLEFLAPRAKITYSADASAPISRRDVGVVVVGETPCAEGYGDVGGPQWAYDPADHGVPREPKTMTLKDTDKAVVDKVCKATSKCVVLVVSGRPQVDTDQLGEIDGLVASWLPGTEGEGVADALFGRRPFTGQLPQTWPRAADQEPINVGDKNYHPLYPFGWGLSTDTAWSRSLPAAQSARSGSDVLHALSRSAELSGHHGQDRQRRLVQLLRQLVQQKVANPRSGVPARPADLIARSDVALLNGNVNQAITLLLRAGGWL